MSDRRSTVISTSYTLAGVSTEADVRRVMDQVSTVAGVGAVAIELVPAGGATMFLKHQADVELDRSAVETALRSAGDYAVVPDRS